MSGLPRLVGREVLSSGSVHHLCLSYVASSFVWPSQSHTGVYSRWLNNLGSARATKI